MAPTVERKREEVTHSTQASIVNVSLIKQHPGVWNLTSYTRIFYNLHKNTFIYLNENENILCACESYRSHEVHIINLIISSESFIPISDLPVMFHVHRKTYRSRRPWEFIEHCSLIPSTLRPSKWTALPYSLTDLSLFYGVRPFVTTFNHYYSYLSRDFTLDGDVQSYYNCTDIDYQCQRRLYHNLMATYHEFVYPLIPSSAFPYVYYHFRDPLPKMPRSRGPRRLPLLGYLDDDREDPEGFFFMTHQEIVDMRLRNHGPLDVIRRFFHMVSAPSIKKEMFSTLANIVNIPSNLGSASANAASITQSLRDGIGQFEQFTTGVRDGYNAADRRTWLQREQSIRQPVVAENIQPRSQEQYGYANSTGFNAGAYIAPIINNAIHFSREYLQFYSQVVSDVFLNLLYKAQMSIETVRNFGSYMDSTELAPAYYFYNELLEYVQDYIYFPTSIFITRTFRRVMGYMGIDLSVVNYILNVLSSAYAAVSSSTLFDIGSNDPPRIRKEFGLDGISGIVDLIKGLLKPLKQLAGAIKDIDTLIKFVNKMFDYAKQIVNWIYPNGVDVSPDTQKLLTKFLAIVEFYKAEDNTHLLGLLNHRLVFMELRDGPDSVLRQLEKFFSDLERRNPNNQSFALFYSAYKTYEGLYAKCVHNGGRGDTTARIEPTVIALHGGVNIGKSTLQNYLVSVIVDTLGEKLDFISSESATYNLNLANKHMDGYQGQPICIIDDIFTTWQNSACSGAGMYNSMVSNTDYVVPQAALNDKGMKFSSKVILTTSNISHPKNLPDVGVASAILRRRDLLVECRRKVVNGAPVPFPTRLATDTVVTNDNFAHLEFRLCNPLKDGEYISMWMDIDDFILKVRNTLITKYEDQTNLVKLLQATIRSKQPDVKSKEDILKEILKENPQHFWYDGVSVMCKDAMCNCLCFYEDAKRYVNTQYTEIVREGIVDSILTTLSDGARSFIEQVKELSPGAKYLAAASIALAGVAAGVALYRRNGKPEKISKEMREDVADWRQKNAEHFKNKPPNYSKKHWRQVLVSREIAERMDRTKTHWEVETCNGNQLVLNSTEPIVNEILIRSDVGGLVGPSTYNDNPYKLTNTPESIRVPLQKNLVFESQNSNETVKIIQKHTYILRRSIGTAHATHVMGQCILSTYHFFHGLVRGEEFELIPCYRGAPQKLLFEPTHLQRLSDGDVCVYWIAGDYCSSSMIKQFMPLRDLAKISHVRNMACYAFTKEDEFAGWGYHTFTNASLAEYVDIHTADGKFREARAMSFASAEAPGRCGALYVATESFNPSILGFHVGNHEGLGYLRLVTREEVQNLVTRLHRNISMPLFEAPPPSTLIKECDTGVSIGANMPFVGLMDARFCKYQKKEHSKIRSPAYDQVYEPTKDQSVLSSRDRRVSPEFRTSSILKKGLEKYSVPFKEMPWQLIKSFEEFHLMRFKKFKIAEKPRVRSWNEVINGVRDELGSIQNYMTGLNMKSSAGFGWKAPPSSSDGGKAYLFDKELTDWGYYYTMKEELKQSVLELERELKAGVAPHLFTTNCLKDELRPLEKIQKGSTRNFVMFPVEWTIVTKAYFMDWTAAMTASHGESSAQVGIDPTGRDWHSMITGMLKYSTEYGFDGDYKAYDGAVFYQQLIPIINAINAWYNDGEQNASIRHGLAVRMIFSFILSENEVHYKNQGQTSGNVLTSPLNCEINAQLFGYAWLMCWFEECRLDPTLEVTKYGLHNMHQYVNSKFYGDDNMHSVKKEVTNWFYPERIAKWINSTGFSITDAEKTGTLRWKNVLDLSFLKMKTRKHCGFYIGQLDEKSIKEMVNWIRDNNLETPEEKLRTNMDTMLRFAFAYGESYYNEMFETLNGWLQQRGFEMMTTTYRDRNHIFLDTKMGVKFGQWDGEIPSIYAINQNEEDLHCPLPGGASRANSEYLSVTSGTPTTCLYGLED